MSHLRCVNTLSFIIHRYPYWEVTYHYELVHFIIDEVFELCFFQFVLVPRVFVEHPNDGNDGLLHVT